MYADDTIIYFPDKDIDIIENVLNLEMEIVSNYCRVNELLLNLKKGKTEVMLFGTVKRLKQNGRQLNISYNGSPISFVTEYVYLGNDNGLDNTLSLSSNFTRAYKRTSNRLRLLNNVRSYLNVNAATKIFNMMIIPILTYAGPIKLMYTKTQMERLASLVRRATITQNETLNNIHNVIQRQNCMLVKKCLERRLNSLTFNDYFKILNHTKNTRNKKDFLR